MLVPCCTDFRANCEAIPEEIDELGTTPPSTSPIVARYPGSETVQKTLPEHSKIDEFSGPLPTNSNTVRVLLNIKCSSSLSISSQPALFCFLSTGCNVCYYYFFSHSIISISNCIIPSRKPDSAQKFKWHNATLSTSSTINIINQAASVPISNTSCE